MSKQCLVCKTINHSAANHCSNCGIELPNKELSEEDKLRIELHNSKETILGLNRALDELKKNSVISEEVQKIILDYKAKLDKEKQENSKYVKLISEKDNQLISITKQLKSIKGSRTNWIVILLIVCVFLGIGLMSSDQEVDNQQNSYSSLEKKISSLESDNSTYLQQISNLEKEKSDLNEIIDSISVHYPLIIKTLKIGNSYGDGTIETDYGNTLYSFSTMFLKPQIEFIGFKNSTVTLYQKIYKDGTLIQGEYSPEGYSVKSDVYITYHGKSELIGLGSETKGNWSSGNYRYEIWYNDMCLKAENIIIY